jgi:hypothetical protein
LAGFCSLAGFWSFFPLVGFFFTDDFDVTVFAAIALGDCFAFGFFLFEAIAFFVSTKGVDRLAGFDLLELVVVFATAFV